LSFSRPDIRGLTFIFRVRDEYTNAQMPIGTTPIVGEPLTLFEDLTSGGNYPCSRGVTTIVNNIRCIYEAGDLSDLTVLYKIHVFDFSYSVNTDEIFGLLYYTHNYRMDLTIEAYGGPVTYDKPYGSLFMGRVTLTQ
jgi:hypothetical protein